MLSDYVRLKKKKKLSSTSSSSTVATSVNVWTTRDKGDTGLSAGGLASVISGVGIMAALMVGIVIYCKCYMQRLTQRQQPQRTSGVIYLDGIAINPEDGTIPL